MPGRVPQRHGFRIETENYILNCYNFIGAQDLYDAKFARMLLHGAVHVNHGSELFSTVSDQPRPKRTLFLNEWTRWWQRTTESSC